jgi:hypothetical protein
VSGLVAIGSDGSTRIGVNRLTHFHRGTVHRGAHRRMPLRPVRDGLSVTNRSRIDDGQRRQIKHAASIVDDVHFRARRTSTNGWRDHMVNAVVPQRPLDESSV